MKLPVMQVKQKRCKFVLYTNPNNVSNWAYTAIGAREVNNVLSNTREYPDSYRILFQGSGTEEDVKKQQRRFPYYQF